MALIRWPSPKAQKSQNTIRYGDLLRNNHEQFIDIGDATSSGASDGPGSSSPTSSALSTKPIWLQTDAEPCLDSHSPTEGAAAPSISLNAAVMAALLDSGIGQPQPRASSDGSLSSGGSTPALSGKSSPVSRGLSPRAAATADQDHKVQDGPHGIWFYRDDVQLVQESSAWQDRHGVAWRQRPTVDGYVCLLSTHNTREHFPQGIGKQFVIVNDSKDHMPYQLQGEEKVPAGLWFYRTDVRNVGKATEAQAEAEQHVAALVAAHKQSQNNVAEETLRATLLTAAESRSLNQALDTTSKRAKVHRLRKIVKKIVRVL